MIFDGFKCASVGTYIYFTILWAGDRKGRDFEGMGRGESRVCSPHPL